VQGGFGYAGAMSYLFFFVLLVLLGITALILSPRSEKKR